MSYILENEAVLKAVPVNTSVIPACCNSFLEAGDYVEAAINEAFNDMMNSIGINELYIYETTGSLVIYEEDEQAAKDIAEKKENFVKRAWGFIKGQFENLLEWLDKKVQDIKDSIGLNIVSKLSGKLEKINDDVVISKEFPTKFYAKYKSGDYSEFIGDILEGIDKLSSLVDKKSDDINYTTKVDKYKDYSGKTIDPAEEKIAELIGNSNINRENIQDIKKVVTDYSEIGSLSPVDKKWVFANIKEIFADIMISKKYQKDIKVTYNRSKKAMNGYIKLAKNIDRDRNTGKDKDNQVHSVQYLKTGITIMSKTVSAHSHVFTKYINYAIGLCIKVVGAKNPKENDDKKKKSSVGESAINITMYENAIDNIFAW